MNSPRTTKGGPKETSKIRLAIPNKGRLFERCHDLLRRMGLDFEAHDRQLSAKVRNLPAEILFLRAGDIPRYVAEGRVDLAITGLDLVEEYHIRVKVLEKLGFGRTDLVVGVPEASGIRSVEELEGKTIATTFPNISRAFLKKKKVKAELVVVGGAVEVAPLAGLADAIIDLVASGSTLRMNHLIPLESIMRSEAVLIGQMRVRKEAEELIRTLVMRAHSVVAASSKRYLMMNAPAARLEEIKRVAPGLASPTVMKLTEPGMIAVHSVIDDADVWSVIEQLKKIGATGILVFPIEKMIP